MRVQVLASVMNEEPMALLERMGLESDAVIINQCHRLGMEEIAYRGHQVRFFSFPDRGVGRSRNEAILRAEGISACSRTRISCMSRDMRTR